MWSRSDKVVTCAGATLSLGSDMARGGLGLLAPLRRMSTKRSHVRGGEADKVPPDVLHVTISDKEQVVGDRVTPCHPCRVSPPTGASLRTIASR